MVLGRDKSLYTPFDRNDLGTPACRLVVLTRSESFRDFERLERVPLRSVLTCTRFHQPRECNLCSDLMDFLSELIVADFVT